MKKRLNLCVVGLFASVSTTAYANITVRDFLEDKLSPENAFYMRGLVDGIEWSNAVTESAVYCAPPKTFKTLGDFINFLDAYIKKSGPKTNRGLADVAFEALRVTYPCQR